MNIRYIILPLILFYSCSEEIINTCNAQDPSSDCYIIPPNKFMINSYSPSGILLSFDNQNLTESISIERTGGNEDISYTLSKNQDNQFIDFENVLPNTQYNYLVRYKNSSGESDLIQNSISHNFPAVESLQIEALNETSVNVGWYYNIDSIFNESYDFMNWQILKQRKSGVSDWITYEAQDISMNISNDNYYQYVDDENIQLNDSLKYQISLKIGDFESNVARDSIQIDFPQLESLVTIPMNAKAIAIQWDIGSSDLSSGTISAVKISNQFNGPGEFIYEGNENSGVFIDLLDNANIPIYANHEISYEIVWCGLDDCEEEQFSASTFPIYNMQYVPSMADIDLNSNIVSTDAFYIDIYEIHDNIYDNDDSNGLDPELSSPKSGISIDSARDYCDRRSLSYLQEGFSQAYSGSSVANPNILGFRLPTESEWYVAAAILYNWEDSSTTSFQYTTQVGDGVINCQYGNIMNCGGEAMTVGSYSSASNCSSCQESSSPNGLYDCNGNLKEWVEKSNQYNYDVPNNVHVVMGGDYMSAEGSVTNSTLEYSLSGHETIGFRTVISAEPFFNYLESLDE
tara:strand:- start:10276 stop:11991 length:1716 start_codon:yes stop_codon:yes gene_type:complete